MIKALQAADDFSALAIRGHLTAQTGDSNRWPDDEEFKMCWMMVKFYMRLKKAKARMVLEAIETSMYTGKTEKVQIEKMLTIEHLMPKEWKKHWPLPPGIDTPDAIEKSEKIRNDMLHRVGNLTLLTKRLNPSISNGAWEKKREKILEHSALALNRAFQHAYVWNEATVMGRSEELLKYAMKLWPHPPS